MFYLLYGTFIYYRTFYLLYRRSIIMSPFIINAQHFRPPTYYFTFLLFITQWHFDPNGAPYLCSMYIVYELLNNLC